MRQNVLLPSGEVVLCCNDYGLKYKLGNLLIDSYKNLFKSENYKKVIKKQTSGEDVICRYCIEGIKI